jgi:hypothetical protein
VWHAITTELDDELDDELDAPPPLPSPRWRRLLVPVTATAASLAAGLILGLAASSPPPGTLAQIPLTPLPTSDPATSGTADIVESEGVRRIVIQVSEPGRSTPEEYLEAWLIDTDGRQLYSLGALTPNRTTPATTAPSGYHPTRSSPRSTPSTYRPNDSTATPPTRARACSAAAWPERPAPVDPPAHHLAHRAARRSIRHELLDQILIHASDLHLRPRREPSQRIPLRLAASLSPSTTGP